MPSSAIRKILCTSVCATLLTGCGILDRFDKSHAADASAPPVNIVQTADATWLEPTGTPPVVTQLGSENLNSGDGQSRLAALEAQVAQMHVALHQLAAGQSEIRVALAGMKPAAGLVLPPSGASVPASGTQSASVPAPVLKSAVLPDAAPVRLAPSPVRPAPEVALAADAPAAQPRVTSSLSPSPESAWSPPVAAAVPPPVAPAAIPAPASVSIPASPPAAASAVVVQGLRVGEHPGKTRLVLDVSHNVAFRHDLDNSERILMIELPGAAWSAALQKQYAGSPLVAAYQATPDGQGGTRLAIQLRKPVKIAATDTLPAQTGKPARVVIDLSSL